METERMEELTITANSTEREERNMEEMELYFNNGTQKQGYALSDDYTVREIFDELANQQTFDPSKPMSEVILVNTRTSERYRSTDERMLKDLDVRSEDVFQVMYDANVAAASMSPAALRTRMENEWKNIIEPMNRPGFLTITHSPSYDRFHVKVQAPSYVVPGEAGGEPVMKYEHKFTVFVTPGYPNDPPRVSFDDPSQRIAHINVWESGRICISDWSWNMCNIGTTIFKCVHAIAFDPGNWRKDSMACSANLDFVERMERRKKLPTFDLRKIPLPGQKVSPAASARRVMKKLAV
jgi:ubiquitin-protein ligase